MYTILRSALFKRQLLHFVKNYKERAGIKIASKFLDNLEKSINFIGETPFYMQRKLYLIWIIKNGFYEPPTNNHALMITIDELLRK